MFAGSWERGGSDGARVFNRTVNILTLRLFRPSSAYCIGCGFEQCSNVKRFIGYGTLTFHFSFFTQNLAVARILKITASQLLQHIGYILQLRASISVDRTFHGQLNWNVYSCKIFRHVQFFNCLMFLLL